MSQKGIEAALTLVNLGIRTLTLLQLGEPILKQASDTIAQAVREGREVSGEEMAKVAAAAESELARLEARVKD